MLKKQVKSYIINIILFIVITAFCPVLAQNGGVDDELEVKPLYIFQNKADRDPFEPRGKKQAVPPIAEVDITTFRLLGITESGGVKAALFRSKSGNPFGYIFIGTKLYGDNDKVVAGVDGEIKNDEEVILVQGDKEVLFKLEEDMAGNNIRPGESSSYE